MNANRKTERTVQLREHLLLTVLGTNSDSAVYALERLECEADLSPLALIDMLAPEERPGRVLAVCTPEAKARTWDILRCGLDADIEAELVEVTNTGNRDDMGDFLSSVADRIPAGVDLTVDITHGFRHYSFLTFIVVMYLSALRDVRVRGVYYGMLQPAPAVSPFVDLSPLLELQELIYAVRTLGDTGSAMPFVAAFGTEINADPASGFGVRLSDPSDPVSDYIALSEAHASGLPLEFGNLVHSLLGGEERKQARRQRKEEVRQTVQQQGSGKGTVAKSFEDLRFLDLEVSRGNTSDGPVAPPEESSNSLSAATLPLVEELLGQFRGMLKPFELRAGADWKSRVILDEEELKRQARVIDYQLRCRNTSTAVGMMEEWTISWAAWCRGDTGEWLDFGTVRQRAKAVMAGIKSATCGQRVCNGVCPSSEMCRLGKFWSELTELRNGTHHHGMTTTDILRSERRREALQAVLEYWHCTLSTCPKYGDLLMPVLATDKRVLVSPVGMTPGVLLTALETCRRDERMGEPTLCIIICSDQSQATVNEALRDHGGYRGEIRTLVFQDPQAGIWELDQITGPAGQLLKDAQEVVINITGGTTIMGVAVEKIASDAQKMARGADNSRTSVRRVGLIDLRPPEMQRADPFVVGDAIWIDGPEG